MLGKHASAQWRRLQAPVQGCGHVVEATTSITSDTNRARVQHETRKISPQHHTSGKMYVMAAFDQVRAAATRTCGMLQLLQVHVQIPALPGMTT
jgi:hypothetical protein